MAITTAVTRKLGNDYVQVEVKNSSEGTRYYKVPKQSADTFQKEYVENSKKMYRLSTLLSLSATLGAGALALVFAKRMTNQVLKYIICGVTGVVAGIGATISSQNTAIKSHTQFLKDYDAKEIFYDKPKIAK